MAEILNIGLEPGDKSEIGSEVTSGSSTLTVTTGAAQADTGFGYLSTHDGSNTCYGKNTFTAFTSTDHRFRVYFDVSSLGMTDTSNATIVNLVTADPYSVTSLRITYDSPSTWAIYGITVNNANGLEITGEHTIDESIPHWAEVHVHRASGTGGYIKVYLDGDPTEVASKTSFANDSARQPTECRFGVSSPTATGTSEVDELVLRDDSTEIGAYTGQPEGMITHEGGTNGEWTDTSSYGTGMSVTSGSALAATNYGLQTVIDAGNVQRYNKNVSFPVDSVFRSRFYFDINSSTMPTGARQLIWSANVSGSSKMGVSHSDNDSDGNHHFSVWITGSAGFVEGASVTDAPHYLEVLVDKAAGTATLYLDGSGTAYATCTGGDNVATTQLGMGSWSYVGTPSGTVFTDELVWRPYNVEIGAWTGNVVEFDVETGGWPYGGTEFTAAGGTFEVTPDAALNSTDFGTKISCPTGGDAMYYAIPTPGMSKDIYRVRFYLDLTGYDNSDTGTNNVGLQLRAADVSIIAVMGLKTESGVHKMWGRYKDNSATQDTTTMQTVTDGEHWVEFEYKYGSGDGYFKWWFDGELVEEDTGVSNDSVAVLGDVRWGNYHTAGSSGYVYIDEGILRNSSTAIGTDGAGAGFGASEVDLSLDLTVDDATPDVADNIVITCTISNAAGKSTATGVVADITLPSGLSYVSDDGGGETAESSGVVTWTLPNLAAAGSDVLAITATVLGTGTYTTIAEVTESTLTDSDSTPDNYPSAEDDEDTQALTVTEKVDLSMALVASTATPNVGDNMTFTATATNAANMSEADNLVIKALLPSGYTFVSSDKGAAYNDTTGMWTVGSAVAGGGTAAIVITVTVKGAGTYKMDAEVWSVDQGDIDSTPGDGIGDDFATTTPTPTARIDLTLTATSSDYNPGASQDFTVTYTVLNAADYSTATGVKVHIPIPANAAWQSDTPNEYDQVTTEKWSVTSIAGGASETIDIVWQMTDTVTRNFDAEISEAVETDSTSTWADGSGDDWARVTINGEGGSPLRWFR